MLRLVTKKPEENQPDIPLNKTLSLAKKPFKITTKQILRAFIALCSKFLGLFNRFDNKKTKKKVK